MKRQIYILTGPVGTGKTTRLSKWAARQDSVDGILAPVIGGRRFLVHIATGEQRLLESDADMAKIVTIGKYRFSRDVFAWARQKLEVAGEANPAWLIVDEIGPLELDGKGLEPAVSGIVNNSGCEQRIFLVVRERLVEKVVNHFGFAENEITIHRNESRWFDEI